MDLVKIKDIFTSPDINKNVTIAGWVRAFRAKKFIELNDGSTIKNVQCVISDSSIDEEILKKISIGSSLKIKGDLIKSIGKGQSFEIQILSLVNLKKQYSTPLIAIKYLKTLKIKVYLILYCKNL